MNKYTQMRAIEDLAEARAAIEARSGGKWATPLTIDEYVSIKVAVEAALKLLREDLLGKVAD